MKKVLVDLERLKYPKNGLGVYCHYLERGLRALAKQGSVQLSYYKPEAKRERGEVLHRWWHRWVNLAPMGYDLLHITHQLQVYFPSQSRAKVLVTLHDLNFIYEELSPRRYRRELQKVRANLNRADTIVCISHFVRQSLLEHRHLFNLKPGVSIEVIYNGVELYGGGTEELERPLLGGENREYFVAIGVLSPKKRQHLLIELLPYLPDRYHLVLLYSEAKEEYHNLLQERVVSLGLSERVHFYCGVSEEAKYAFLKCSLGLLHPSRAEGFGLPVVEAMSLGIPVFLSSETSLPEIGGEEAYYWTEYTPRAMSKVVLEGMEEFVRDTDKARRLRSWAGRYSPDRMGAEYMALYQSLVQRD